MPSRDPHRLLSAGQAPPRMSLSEAVAAAEARRAETAGVRQRAHAQFAGFTARGPRLTVLARIYAAGRAVQRFIDERRIDSAATLSFYFLLAVVPAGGAIVLMFSLIGQGDSTVDNLVTWLARVTGDDGVHTLKSAIGTLARSHTDIIVFVLGVLLSLWSAAKFVSALGTTINHVYGVAEGRGFFRRRGQAFVLTLVLVPLLVAAITLIIADGGFIARAGFSNGAVVAWRWLHFPAAAAVMFIIIALLYTTSSNVRQAHIIAVTGGAIVAMVGWLATSIVLLVAVFEFRFFTTSYGSLAGFVVVLMWLWLSCYTLVYGALFDAELMRARQLAAGIPAETEIWVSPRAHKRQLNHNQREETFARMGASLRASSGGTLGKVRVRDFWAR